MFWLSRYRHKEPYSSEVATRAVSEPLPVKVIRKPAMSDEDRIGFLIIEKLRDDIGNWDLPASERTSEYIRHKVQLTYRPLGLIVEIIKEPLESVPTARVMEPERINLTPNTARDLWNWLEDRKRFFYQEKVRRVVDLLEGKYPAFVNLFCNAGEHDVKSWLEANTTGRYMYLCQYPDPVLRSHGAKVCHKFWCESEDDAMLIKLTWTNA